MINIRPLIEQHLRSAVPEFIEVAGAADLANVMQGRVAAPGCYVFQERATARPDNVIGATVQRVTLQVAVITVVRNVKDSRGTDAADASAGLQQSVQTALLGWQADAAVDPLEYVGGVLVSFANGYFIWKDSYQTYQFIRSI